MERGRQAEEKREKRKVSFLPSGREVFCARGTTILEAARQAGLYIEAACGGAGKCGKCRVRVVEGDSGPWTAEESLHLNSADKESGYRLACRAAVRTDTTVFAPKESLFKGRPSKKGFRAGRIHLNPAVRSCTVDLRPASSRKGDARTLLTSLLRQQCGEPSLSLSDGAYAGLMKSLRDRQPRAEATVWMDREVIQTREGPPKKLLGLALDVGTTTVALYLCDLRNGKVLASAAAGNPQIVHGDDIISRITYSLRHPKTGVKRMQGELFAVVNRLVRELTERFGCLPADVVDMTVVGNTAMHHIFLGIAPDSLGMSPFTPSMVESVEVGAADLGIDICPDAYVHALPVEAGFVGADNVAVVLSEEPHLKDDHVLIMDLGTNGELVAGNRTRLYSCSCATGPALEGARITWGMRAVAGAIDKVNIDPATFDVEYSVIGNQGQGMGAQPASCKPAGICGSGIIDAVAQLYKGRLVQKNGAFSKTITTRRLRRGQEGIKEFLLVPAQETAVGKDIVVTQNDVRQIQLAKAALYAGCTILMRRLGISRFRKILIAGAFGVHIDVESALAIGLFPFSKGEKVFLVGNAAGRGAYLALVDREKRAEADRIARWIEHVELAAEGDFQKEFIAALAFP